MHPQHRSAYPLCSIIYSRRSQPLDDARARASQDHYAGRPSYSLGGTLYAGTEEGKTFKTTDGGNNWVVLNTSLWRLTIDPQQPNTLYAVTTSGLSKSTDGGTN